MIIMRRKPQLNTLLIDALVHSYLAYIKTTGEELTCSEISEAFRYALCVAQGLGTKGYSERVEAIGNGAVPMLKDVLSKYSVRFVKDEVKRGLLEACVYSMEAARNRVLGVVVQ